MKTILLSLIIIASGCAKVNQSGGLEAGISPAYRWTTIMNTPSEIQAFLSPMPPGPYFEISQSETAAFDSGSISEPASLSDQPSIDEGYTLYAVGADLKPVKCGIFYSK